MTGAGKSALGNLIANQQVFVSADDTASVTNPDSVLRYDAQDSSLQLLDTIGLGDTEIDQDKVTANIRDVALSAPHGVDVLLFVMRHARITDDAIARLIYVTEYLWGQDCLQNLYVVVTFASKFVVKRHEANEWIFRQAELNWRFKHIFNLVDNNTDRFIFVDNPSTESEEPNADERQGASREAVMRVLAAHPRDVIPPFTHALMKRAQKMVDPHLPEEREQEVKALSRQGSTDLETTASSDLGHERRRQGSKTSAQSSQSSQAGTKKSADPAVLENARKRRAEAKAKRLVVYRKALEEVKQNPAFKQEVARHAEAATMKFAQRYQHQADETKGKSGVPTTNPVVACKKMLSSLGSKFKSKAGVEPKRPTSHAKSGARGSPDLSQRQRMRSPSPDVSQRQRMWSPSPADVSQRQRRRSPASPHPGDASGGLQVRSPRRHSV